MRTTNSLLIKFCNFMSKNEPDLSYLEGVKILIKKPPIYKSVCNTFGIKDPNACFTFGDTIYNPTGIDIPEEMIEHEKLHMEQQHHNKKGAALWWGKFLRDPEFRLDQEARAYAVQYDVVCERVKDRNQRHRYMHIYAMSLSSPLYGNMTSYTVAMHLLRKFSKTLR